MCRDVVAVLKRLKEQRDMSLNEVRSLGRLPPRALGTHRVLPCGPPPGRAAAFMSYTAGLRTSLAAQFGLHRPVDCGRACCCCLGAGAADGGD